jgi:uncharacterized protein YkwD
MAPTRLTALLTTVTVVLLAPAGAHARTPCPAEQAAPTALNGAQVSDAVFCLSNQIRANYGLPAFRRDARLDAAALLHSTDMGVRSFFAHTNPDGLTPTNRAAAQGYPLGVGENIAYGYPNARSVVLAWMASAGHCRNLLSGARDLGVGTAVSSSPYYTQSFGDYFSRAIDESPRAGCPYVLNLDALSVADTVAGAQPAAAPPPPSPVRTTAVVSRPALSALSLSSARFRAGGRGTTISYTLSAPATVTFRIQRAAGRTARYSTLTGRLTDRGEQGANALRFRGRLGGRTLRPGRYRLQALATDAAGATSPLARSRFVVVRGAQRAG